MAHWTITLAREGAAIVVRGEGDDPPRSRQDRLRGSRQPRRDIPGDAGSSRARPVVVSGRLDEG